jgi:uncharacterized damage-inducible protein DinB
MNTTDLLIDGLLSQFKSTWIMLREAIDKVPEEFWCLTEHDWSYSKTVYHIIETQEFYLRDTPKGMEWGKLLKKQETQMKESKESYLSKKVLLEYLEDTKQTIVNYFNIVSYDNLFAKDGFDWFDSVFQKLLYLLRHNAHHLGELGRMLREWECNRMKWY